MTIRLLFLLRFSFHNFTLRTQRRKKTRHSISQWKNLFNRFPKINIKGFVRWCFSSFVYYQTFILVEKQEKGNFSEKKNRIGIVRMCSRVLTLDNESCLGETELCFRVLVSNVSQTTYYLLFRPEGVT